MPPIPVHLLRSLKLPCEDWAISESATRPTAPFCTSTRGCFGAIVFVRTCGASPIPSSLSLRRMGGSVTWRRIGRGELGWPVFALFPNRGEFIATPFPPPPHLIRLFRPRVMYRKFLLPLRPALRPAHVDRRRRRMFCGARIPYI